MIQVSPFEIADFTGGITDKFVDADQTKAQVCDNLEITVNRKLLSRPGSELLDAAHPRVGDQGTRVGHLIPYDAESVLLAQQGLHLYRHDATSGWVKIARPTDKPVFALGDATSVVSHTQGQKHLILANEAYSPIVKVYRDHTGALQARTAGLPMPSGTPTFSFTQGAPAPNSYIYAAHYAYEYKVEDKTFVDYGPVWESSIKTLPHPSVSPVTVAALPLLANTANTSYELSAIKIFLYRTINGGTVLYKLAELASGITSYTDQKSDDDLLTGEPLYTTGDVRDNDPPPPAKYVHISGAFCYYANVEEDGAKLTTRIRQSVANDYDSCPADFWVDVNTEITGISSVRGNPIVLTTKGIYRIEGVFDELGQGGMIAQLIDDTVDCVGHNTIVQVLDGIVWLASDGVYFSDGFKVQKISMELAATYTDMVATASQRKRIVGIYDQIAHRVYWSVQRIGGTFENDSLLVLDLRWGVRPHSTFTTWSGGASFKPTAICMFGGYLHRGDSRGYVLKHDPEELSDPLINPALPLSHWGRETIRYDFTTSALSFGSLKARKWVSKMNLSIDTITNVSVQVFSINDTLRRVKPLAEIRFRAKTNWGDFDVAWGNTARIWNFQGAIQEIRRMPAGSLRSSYKQLKITNGFTQVIGSDFLGEALVNGVTKQAVLLGAPLTVEWPLGSVDYCLTFENDNYTREYRVSARTDDTLTFEDPFGVAPSGQLKWVLKGYPKNEVMNLQSVTLYVSDFSDSIAGYPGKEGGNS